MGLDKTPPELREGVRSGIFSAVRKDVELRGGRTARLLAAAGAIGILGAAGMSVLIAEHPYGHHPHWHAIVFAAIWSGLLVVSLAVMFLQVRTPSLPLARSARIGILGLGVAGICGAICPDQHFLHWWSETAPGGWLGAAGGPVLSTICFGLATSLVFGAVAAFVGVGRRLGPIRPLLPAAILLLLLSPGVALQSFGSSWLVFAGWLIGTAVGAYGGVSTGIRVRRLLGGG